MGGLGIMSSIDAGGVSALSQRMRNSLLCRLAANSASWDYFRICGAIQADKLGATRFHGLSPRMRRNRSGAGVGSLGTGSISAHAEEPAYRPISSGPDRVYLRACGGTVVHRLPLCHVVGLSPRMRRNLLVSRRGRGGLGSISAHAEEPACGWGAACRPWVYLRACGGTSRTASRRPRWAGLSPRMRRNPGYSNARDSRAGSISAHAEEPARPPGTSRTGGVYLRACGGTSRSSVTTSRCRGLSPRMRRNQGHGGRAGNLQGSISAHAEEPSRSFLATTSAGVYLRACGGTSCSVRTVETCQGLSPRMRRNR